MGKVIYHPAARAELRDAAAYYEANRYGLGRKFLAAVDEAVAHICGHPQMGAVIHSPYRRFLVRKFPYGIIYRETGDTIYIVAVMHLRRKPAYWMSRVNPEQV